MKISPLSKEQSTLVIGKVPVAAFVINFSVFVSCMQIFGLDS